ncbi:MAG: hypothetical protein WD599_01775 [Balneolaceae bacterium]
MTTKDRIIEKIGKIEDPELLRELDRWIDLLLATSEVDTFSEDEVAAVHEGYEQYIKGDVINQEEANKLFNEWIQGK